MAHMHEVSLVRAPSQTTLQKPADSLAVLAFATRLGGKVQRRGR